MSLCSGPKEGLRDALSLEQDFRLPSPGASVSPEPPRVLAWPRGRPRQWKQCWEGTKGPPFQVRTGGAAAQSARLQVNRCQGPPTRPQNTTGHLCRGGRVLFYWAPVPSGSDRDSSSLLHHRAGVPGHPEPWAQFRITARSRVRITVSPGPGPRRWGPPERASAQRGGDSDPPPRSAPTPPTWPPHPPRKLRSRTR